MSESHNNWDSFPDGYLSNFRPYMGIDYKVCDAFARDLLNIYYNRCWDIEAINNMLRKLGDKECQATIEALFPADHFPNIPEIRNAILTA